LRAALEAEDIDSLPNAITGAQQALDKLNTYPGGVEQLRLDMDALPSPLKEEVKEQLEQATVDHHINGELIRLAAQKNAALQAFIAQQSDSATYSSTGNVPGLGSGTFSKKV
jgi:hypothetical protein